MNITQKLTNAKSPLFTFEILPPLKGKGVEAVHSAIEPLLDFDPAYINITYHSAEVVYKTLADGKIERQTIRKRPGTVALAAAIKFKYGVEVVPHLICSGLNAEETENILIDLHFLGIHNLLALRGDPPKGTRIFMPKEGGHAHTTELMQQINAMNKGIYLDDNLKTPQPTCFGMGVAGYPEKHFEAPNKEVDIQYLRKKVDLGAEYIVTQMFFDNQKYIDFVADCRAAGISVPIIPGIKPIASLNDIRVLPQVFSIDLPHDLVQELQKCTSNEQARTVGVEWAVEQSLELKKYGVPSLHYYTLGETDNMQQICKRVF
ncbi:MAG: methylenetetrahydrofolate reductase [Bacteroidales bacterium]